MTKTKPDQILIVESADAVWSGVSRHDGRMQLKSLRKDYVRSIIVCRVYYYVHTLPTPLAMDRYAGVNMGEEKKDHEDHVVTLRLALAASHQRPIQVR